MSAAGARCGSGAANGGDPVRQRRRLFVAWVGDCRAVLAKRLPTPPLVANVTAAPVSDPDGIRNLLIEQVTSRVRWRESVLAMRDLGVEELCEIGAGKVLTGLVRRIDRELGSRAIGSPADIEEFLGSL